MLEDKKFIGVYTDMCAFFDDNIIDADKNKSDFMKNLSVWRSFGVNLITVGLQSPSPFAEYYKKAREQDRSAIPAFGSSALKYDGGLNYDFLENAEEIIRFANELGFTVLVNILSPACENIFEDELAVFNGVFNAADWLRGKNFGDILVNITDVSHTFYKSGILNGSKIISLLKSVGERTENKLILGTGIKSFAGVSERNISEYIKASGFIPVYSDYSKSNHNTKKMLEKIYFFREHINKAGVKIPVIIAKGDDLSERYNSYGRNNLEEAFENGVSWCYYDPEGFVILKNDSESIDWDKNSSPEKKRFFEFASNILV